MDDTGGQMGVDTLSVKQAAQAFNVSEKTIRRWIRDGRLEATQIAGPYGMTWRIPASAVQTAQQVVDVLPVERPVDPRTLGLIIAQAVTESNHALTQELTQQIGELKHQVTQLTQRLEEQHQHPTEDSNGVPQLRPRERTDLELVAQMRQAMREVVHEEITSAAPQPSRRSWWPWRR